MPLLEEAIVGDHHDVVVVGAGIGGITAAALLANRGLDVLVVEQHYLPGGCCSAIRRRHFTMDVGATVLYGFGEQGLNAHRHVMNELEEPIDVAVREAMYRLHVGPDTITFWYDFDRFLGELVALFPGQRAELERYFEYSFDLYRNTILKTPFIMPPTEVPTDSLGAYAGNPWMEELVRWFGKSGGDLFREFFTDERLIRFFDMLTRTFSYVDADECPAVLSLTMFVDNHIGGAYYPLGSPQMLPNKLERAFERHGGTILYRHLVEEILVEDGRARGVRLAGGTVIGADRVVSDATIWNLYGGLVPEEHCDPQRTAWARGLAPTHANFMIYAGVDGDVVPADARPMEVFIDNPDDVAGHGITVYLPGLLDPSVQPPGSSSVTISEVSSETWPRPWEPEYRSDTYRRRKDAAARGLLGRAERHLPGFGDAVRVMETATPTTIERYTLKNWGNVGGPKQMIGQDLTNRPTARSDWENLYLCGDSTVMGLGVLPSTISAVGAANLVLRDLGADEYRQREHTQQYVQFATGRPRPPLPDPAEPLTDATASLLAGECRWCEEPGCVAGCPAGIDLPGFLRRVEAGNFAGAAAVMRERNPFAELCGHLCPAERFCEPRCVRNSYDDGPVRIAAIHAWACGPAGDGPAYEAAGSLGTRVAVVGAGPAGLSCAHFLARLGHGVHVLDRRDRAGGVLAHALLPSRMPQATVDHEIALLVLPDIAFEFGRTLGVTDSLADLRASFDAVFLAPGLGRGRSLEVPGVEPKRATDALALLEAHRRGDTTGCEGQRVVVVGGGSVAHDAAVAAAECGAKAVTVVSLEERADMPALPTEITELEAVGVDLRGGWGPQCAAADVLTFARCIALHDEDGRFSPRLDATRTLDVAFDRIVWAVGQALDPALHDHLRAVLGSATVEVDPDTQAVAGHPGLYAGGDLVRGAGTIVEAAADGRRAAAAIHGRLA